MTFLGVVFVAAALWAVATRRERLVWVLAAAMPFNASAAVVVGEIPVQPFYLVAIVAWLCLVFRGQSEVAPDNSLAVRLLKAFTIWGVIVTMTAPFVFRGIGVLDPAVGIDAAINAPSPLAFDAGNVAQLGYLLLAASVVLFILRQAHVSPHVVGLGFAVGGVLSAARLVADGPMFELLFDNNPEIVYARTLYEGVVRHRGIFPEPSYLAGFSVAAAAFCLVMLGRTRHGMWWCYLILLGITGINLVASFSGTAVAAAGICVISLAAWWIGTFLLGRARVSSPVMLGVLTVAFVAVIVGALTWDQIWGLADDKSGSASFENRFASDQFSWRLVWDTYGYGVGLGSNRPSSFATYLLSSVGLVGFTLMVLVVASVMRGAHRVPEWRPTAYALYAAVVAKVVSEPDISTPTMWMLIGLCVYAATRHKRGDDARMLGRSEDQLRREAGEHAVRVDPDPRRACPRQREPDAKVVGRDPGVRPVARIDYLPSGGAGAGGGHGRRGA